VTDSNRRADFRIGVPAHYVRQLAVWPSAGAAMIRLSLADLGAPLMACAAGPDGAMRLMDISVQGLGLCVKLPHPCADILEKAAFCHTYLKLWDPSLEDPYSVLSVFTCNRIMRVVRRDGWLLVGARFMRFAVGSRLEKELEFLDAQICGVSVLARWCDNLARGEFSHPGQARTGLDLDNLLAELSYVLASGGEPSQDRSKEST